MYYQLCIMSEMKSKIFVNTRINDVEIKHETHFTVGRPRQLRLETKVHPWKQSWHCL